MIKYKLIDVVGLQVCKNRITKGIAWKLVYWVVGKKDFGISEYAAIRANWIKITIKIISDIAALKIRIALKLTLKATNIGSLIIITINLGINKTK